MNNNAIFVAGKFSRHFLGWIACFQTGLMEEIGGQEVMNEAVCQARFCLKDKYAYQGIADFFKLNRDAPYQFQKNFMMQPREGVISLSIQLFC